MLILFSINFIINLKKASRYKKKLWKQTETLEWKLKRKLIWFKFRNVFFLWGLEDECTVD